MGNALIMMTVPQEMIPVAALRTWKGRRAVGIPGVTQPTEWKPRREVEAILAEHPDAFWMLPVPRSAVWEPPEEPPNSRSDGPARRTHDGRVRYSLLRFLNDRLGELDGMVRTGWWVLQQARVRLATFQGTR